MVAAVLYKQMALYFAFPFLIFAIARIFTVGKTPTEVHWKVFCAGFGALNVLFMILMPFYEASGGVEGLT